MEQTKNIWTPTPTGLYVNIVPVRNRYSHQAFPIGLCYAKPDERTLFEAVVE